MITSTNMNPKEHLDIITNDDQQHSSYDDNDEDDDTFSKDSNISENEIPIWVSGEQRWITGVTDETTCIDLIEALIADGETLPISGNGKLECNKGEMKPNDFVIIEKWKKMEQILEPNTKIFKIWNAWGVGQSEVRFSLHRIDSNRRLNGIDGGDSGRGSPTGSINSAIERRKRHRASKSSSVWLTHAQTIHPKSQKATIEKLMTLILEQGETIQQQLRKLRDKEIQISRIEEDRHKLREKEHGKNYLLETYLNGLHEADDKDLAKEHSDSGINTEDTATPDVGMQSPATLHEDEIKIESTTTTETQYNDDNSIEQIEMLEKMVSINKKLQREEELLLKLTVKIRRYEYENPNLTEDDMKREINKINEEIDKRNRETAKTEQQLQVYDEVLKIKSNVLDQLMEEYEQMCEAPPAIPPPPPDDALIYRSHTPEILSPPPQFQTAPTNVTEVQIHSIPNQIIKQHPNFFNNPTVPVAYTLKNPPPMFNHSFSVNENLQNANHAFHHYQHPHQLMHFEKSDQRNLNVNNTNTNNYVINSNCSSNIKLAPKKFLINSNNNNILSTTNAAASDTNSDTGLSSMGDATDMSQLGTLV